MLAKSPSLPLGVPQSREARAEPHVYGTTEEKLRRAAILIALYLMPAMWILQPVISDQDIWWHLQTGKWIVDHGTLPTTDPFSAYGEGKPWIAYSWLFEIGMYGLLRVFGEAGIAFYTLFLTWAIMLVLHRMIAARVSSFVVVCGLLAGCVIAMSRLFTPRSWLLTILFFAITLEVVLSLREGKSSRWQWCLPLLYVMWANIHIQFIYGLGLLGLANAAPLLDRFVSSLAGMQSLASKRSPAGMKLIGLTALCVIATLVTPYHVRLYSIVAELSAQTGMWDYAQEMQAPAFRTIADWAMLALFAVALVHLGRRTSWSLFEVLLLFVAGAFALRGQRDVWFLVLAAIAVLIPKQAREAHNPLSILPRGGLASIALFVAVGVLCIAGYRGYSPERIQQNTAKIYPIEAASFVEQQGFAGPLYNHFDWGGYLIWRLPNLKVSMDGRANIHGDDRIRQAIGTWTGHSRWVDDPELNEAEVVIAQKNMALAALLRLDPRFHLAYQDDTAVVFIRVSTNSSQPKPQSGPPTDSISPTEHVAFAAR